MRPSGERRMISAVTDEESWDGMPLPEFHRAVSIEPYIIGGEKADRDVAAKYLRRNWARLAAEAWIKYQQFGCGRCVVVVPWERAKASVLMNDPQPFTIRFAGFDGQAGGPLTTPAFVKAGQTYLPEREVLFLFRGEPDGFVLFVWAALLPTPVDAAKARAN